MKHRRQLTPLQAALAVSALAHLGLLMLHVAPDFMPARVLGEQPLAVVLVNAQDDAESDPEQASAVAQARLAGGGTEASGRISSPLPASEQDRVGVTDGAESARQQQPAEQAGKPLLASLRLHDARLPLSEREAADAQSALEQERRQRELSSLLARSSSASSWRPAGRASATSARRRARRSTRATTPNCGAGSRSAARPNSRSSPGNGSTASSRC